MELLLLILVPFAFFLGWLCCHRLSINYKERWQTATKLLNEERVSTAKALTGGHKQISEAVLAAKRQRQTIPASSPALPVSRGNSYTTAQHLHKLCGLQRFEAEGARLKSNLGVVDDLAGLNAHWTAEMLKRRARYGIG